MDQQSGDNSPQPSREVSVHEEVLRRRPASYQRNYRACQLCRQKKIRCDLGDLNNPQPPCIKCKREKKNCVFGSGGRSRKQVARTGHEVSSTQRTKSSTSRGGTNAELPEAAPDLSDLVDATAHRAPEAGSQQATGSRTTDACSQSIVETVVRDDSDALQLLFDATGPLNTAHDLTSKHGASFWIKHGVLEQLPELTQSQRACWRGFPSCLQHFVSPTEVVAYLNFFFSVLNNQMPILSDWYADMANHGALLTHDTMLCYTILMISSRYLILPGRNGVSRGYLLHDHFFKYVQEALQGILWGVSFGRQIDKSLIGNIESLILVTQWQPRNLNLQTSSFDISRMAAVYNSSQNSAGDYTDDDAIPTAASMALQSDMMCWRLANLAVTLSFECGIFDEEHSEYFAADTCSGHELRVPRLQQLLYIYVSHLAARLKRPNPLASVSMARIKQNVILMSRASASDQNSQLTTALNMWIDLIELGTVTMDMLYPTSGGPATVVSRDRQDSMVRHLISATLRWWSEFETLEVPTTFRLSIEVEYHYLRILINSIGLQSNAHQGPQSATWQSYVPFLGLSMEEPLLQEVKRSCCRVFEIIIELHKLQALRSITAPFLLRLVTVSMFGLKVITLSEMQNDSLMTVLSDAVVTLRESAVDDLHLAGYYASLLERLARKARNTSSHSTSPANCAQQEIQTTGYNEHNVGEVSAALHAFDPPSGFNSDQWDDWLAFQFDPTLAVIESYFATLRKSKMIPVWISEWQTPSLSASMNISLHFRDQDAQLSEVRHFLKETNDSRRIACQHHCRTLGTMVNATIRRLLPRTELVSKVVCKSEYNPVANQAVHYSSMRRPAEFINAVTARRSHYKLGRSSHIDKEALVDIIRSTILHCPSSFNSQSTRLLVLLNEENNKLWEITKGTLKMITPPESFAATSEKIDGLSGGYGTILFYEDPISTRELETRYPLYGTRFSGWADQSNAMHQYILWTALSASGLGCNLQHYNPIIDQKVAAEWNVNPQWILKAQLPFGEIEADPKEKLFKPWEDRVRIVGL